VENYFNYFTEIEEHFCRRRGTHLYLSTIDWALMEIWKDAGIPLEAVLRGIDEAFDQWDRKPSKTRKINGLAWSAQAVLTAAEDMKEAAVGAMPEQRMSEAPPGFHSADICGFLRRNADQLESAKLPAREGITPGPLAKETAQTLREIASGLEAAKALPRLEDLERRLTVAEEKLFAVLLAAIPDEQIVAVRAEADRELAPYRRKMQAAQIEHLQKQFAHKRLLEKYGLPRLSLFYM
jgi:hypothetical protein